MKRFGLAVMSVAVGCALTSCGSGGGGEPPLATVITDRPTGIAEPPAATRSTVPPVTATTTTTATPSTSSAAAQAVPSQYSGRSTGWYYFSSPSGKFECAIAVTDTSIAGCHGSLPDSAPRVPGSGATGAEVQPNSVQLIAGSQAQFVSLGDPKFHRFDGTPKVLPYGEVLSVPGNGSSNGLRCTVDEKSGVTCADQVGHGFTVSDDAFDLR